MRGWVDVADGMGKSGRKEVRGGVGGTLGGELVG